MREQFEKLPEIAELLIEAQFDEQTGEYVSYWSYKSGYLNGAWYAYQEQQAEIDELKSKKEFRDFSQDAAIKNIKEKHEKQVSGLAKTITKMDLEIDELHKRIDRALVQVSNHYQSCVARKELKRMSASASEIAEIESHESNMIVLDKILKGELK